MEPIILAIIEDFSDMRNGLVDYLSTQKEFATIESYRTMEEMLERLQNGFKPDVVLSDIGLPGIDGVTGIKLINAIVPEADIIMLTVFMDGTKIFNALCAGATGYILKGTPMPDIHKAILEIRSGGSYMSPSIARKVVEHFKFPAQQTTHNLTKREGEVINGLLDGLSYKLIAERLFVSVDAVRFHIKSIYTKLHVNSKGELISKYLKGEL
jgi:DNA-binding NarL/FixJ family response regulator